MGKIISDNKSNIKKVLWVAGVLGVLLYGRHRYIQGIRDGATVGAMILKLKQQEFANSIGSTFVQEFGKYCEVKK